MSAAPDVSMRAPSFVTVVVELADGRVVLFVHEFGYQFGLGRFLKLLDRLRRPDHPLVEVLAHTLGHLRGIVHKCFNLV